MKISGDSGLVRHTRVGYQIPHAQQPLQTGDQRSPSSVVQLSPPQRHRNNFDDSDYNHLGNRTRFQESDNPTPPDMVRGMGVYPSTFSNLS